MSGTDNSRTNEQNIAERDNFKNIKEFMASHYHVDEAQKQQKLNQDNENRKLRDNFKDIKNFTDKFKNN